MYIVYMYISLFSFSFLFLFIPRSRHPAEPQEILFLLGALEELAACCGHRSRGDPTVHRDVLPNQNKRYMKYMYIYNNDYKY